jgi:subtilisin family serine protease
VPPDPDSEPDTDPGDLPGSGIRVGILDTRLVAHTELVGRYVTRPAGPYQLPELPAAHTHGHAAFVTGIILRQAPGADVQAHQVLDDADGRATAWKVANRMVDLVGTGIDVLNMSFGCTTSDGRPPLVLARAVDLLTPDVVLIAAAGNHGAEDNAGAAAAVYPAAFDDVIAVGADDGTGAPAAFSPALPWVDLTAPGVEVTSTYPVRRGDDAAGPGYEGQARWSGTSFATAHVTGVIAAMATRDRDTNRGTARAAVHTLMELKPGHDCCGVRRHSLAS